MTPRNWFITGVSSGFGRELATHLLGRGDTVLGTVRRPGSAADLIQKYPDTFRCELLDVTDAAAVRDVVDRSFTSLGRIDVVVSNAGYGLFGAAEELSDEQSQPKGDPRRYPR
jgi:NAD(P)-dependent dehydrogenase (short-subunit alcohol dehydrogenase family)